MHRRRPVCGWVSSVGTAILYSSPLGKGRFEIGREDTFVRRDNRRGCVLIASCAESQTTFAERPDGEVNSGFPPTYFRNTAFRAQTEGSAAPGNSLESFVWGAEQGIEFAESDFRLNAENILISAHDNEIGGDCGDITKNTLEELRECRLDGGFSVGTLGDLLAQPYDEVFIDLKNTRSKDNQEATAAVQSAIDAITIAGRKDDAVLMVYRTPDSILELLWEHDVRMGLKGYPGTGDEMIEMVDDVARLGFELVCVNIKWVTPEVIDYSADRGVWHLAWDTGLSLETWKKRASVGLGGLINQHIDVVREQVEPLWSSLE